MTPEDRIWTLWLSPDAVPVVKNGVVAGWKKKKKWPANISGPHPWNLYRSPYEEKGLCRCDSMKDPGVGRLPHSVQVGSKWNHKCPQKRNAEGELIQKRWRHHDHRDRDHGHAATWGGRRQVMDSLAEAQVGAQPWSPPPGRLIRILNFWPPERSENKFLRFSATFVVTGYGNHRKRVMGKDQSRHRFRRKRTEGLGGALPLDPLTRRSGKAWTAWGIPFSPKEGPYKPLFWAPPSPAPTKIKRLSPWATLKFCKRDQETVWRSAPTSFYDFINRVEMHTTKFPVLPNAFHLYSHIRRNFLPGNT